MAAAPLLPLLNWAARPANVGRVVGSAVGDSVCVAFCEPSEGEVLLPLPLPPVDAETLPAAEADADAGEPVGLYVMAVPLAVALEDPAASTVWLAAVEEAEAVRLPVLEEKGQWNGIEDEVEDTDHVAAALSGLDEKGQWNGMDDKVSVPDEVGPGPWKGADEG
jgi:hypothetical protein